MPLLQEATAIGRYVPPDIESFGKEMGELYNAWNGGETDHSIEIPREDGRDEVVHLRRPFDSSQETIVFFSGHPACVMVAGGTLQLAAERGANVVLIDVTKGTAGLSDHTPAEIGEMRMAESLKAVDAMGIHAYANLDLPDGSVGERFNDLVVDATQLTRVFAPTMIMTHPGEAEDEYHPDHRDTNEGVAKAVFNSRNSVNVITGVPIAPDGDLAPSFYTADVPGLLVRQQFAPVGMLVGLTRDEMHQKREIFEIYGSQEKKRPVTSPGTYGDGTIKDLEVRGYQTSGQFPGAEGFNQDTTRAWSRTNRMQSLLPDRNIVLAR